MATITSNGTGGGLWSATATWNGGAVPVDDDTVVIASGDTVTYDVDWSSDVTYPNGVNSITVTGTLKLSRSAGTYYFKLKTGATFTGAGTFDCGTSGDQIPFTAKHTVNLKNGAIGNSIIFTVYCQSPTIPYVRLSNEENTSATRLEIDTDVTGDLWAVNDTVSICNINGGRNVESRTISDIQSTYIDISAGLTASKLQGSYVVLETRHVNFIGTATLVNTNASTIPNITGGRFYNADGSRAVRNKFTIDKTLLHTANMALAGGGYKVSNSVFLNCTSGTREMDGSYINNCAFIGCSTCVQDTVFVYMDRCLFAGNITGLSSVYGTFNDCQFIGNGTGLYKVNNYIISNCIFSGCATNISSYSGIAINCLFGGATDFAIDTTRQVPQISISYNHNQTDSAIKAVTMGGNVASQTSVKPSGYQGSQLHTLASETYENFYYIPFNVPAGESVSVEVQLRKDASMTYLPRAYLTRGMIVYQLPTSFTLVDSFTMTDSTDTWETDTFSIDNSAGTTDKDYTLWFVGKNASGNMYSAYDITTQGGSGGAVSIQPIRGTVSL
jgi:hypothetical protein